MNFLRHLLFSKSNINLENEIEGLKSYPILEMVSDKLNLQANFYANGVVKRSRVSSFPFQFNLNISGNSIEENHLMKSHLVIMGLIFNLIIKTRYFILKSLIPLTLIIIFLLTLAGISLITWLT